jgi:transglutaminase-like putative cysteine protease
MKRFPNLRPLFSLALLWLAAIALVWTLKLSIRGLNDAAFLPVAIPAMVLAYWLGLRNWPAHRTAAFMITIGVPLILMEATRTSSVVWQLLIHLPELQLKLLVGWLTGQTMDLSFFRIQFDEMLNLIEVFLRGLVIDGAEPGPALLELSWDVPLFIVSAWSGWWTSRQNSILIALIPSLAMQAFLLNYARRPEGLMLQVCAFILIFLMGFHQKWSLSKSQSKTQGRVRMETYATVFILSSVLAVAAGLISRPPAQEQVVQQQPQTQQVTTTAAEQNVVEEITGSMNNSSSPPPGLPQEHQITTPPQSLMDVIFLASDGENPFPNEGVIVDEPAVRQGYYWRWITYDQYNGRGWSSSTPTAETSYSAGQPLFEFSGVGYDMVHQTIIKASAADDHLYWPGALMRADQPVDTTWRTSPPSENPLLHMDMLGTLVQAQQYSADSLVPQFNETQLRAASQVYPTEILQKYLTLPRDISQRVRDLAVTLTYQAQNPYDKAKAIETYLRSYPYTLNVPALPADKEISDYFLFEIKTGYCEYYASAMVVLARTVGLPARMVIGYASNEYDPESGQYIVRQANAHSWVEIYFPEIGWVEFEPTASQPPIERQQEKPEQQPAEDPNIAATPPEPTIKDRDGIIYEKHGYFVGRSPFFAILFSILAFIGACLWYLRVQGLWFSYKTIGSIYQYIYRHGKKIIPGTPSNATPSLFAENLKAKLRRKQRFLRPAAGELDRLTTLYLKETYSPHPVTKDEQEQAVLIWRKLFWRLLFARIILRLPVSLRNN